MESFARGILILFALILLSMIATFLSEVFSGPGFIKVPSLPMAEEVENAAGIVSP